MKTSSIQNYTLKLLLPLYKQNNRGQIFALSNSSSVIVIQKLLKLCQLTLTGSKPNLSLSCCWKRVEDFSSLSEIHSPSISLTFNNFSSSLDCASEHYVKFTFSFILKPELVNSYASLPAETIINIFTYSHLCNAFKLFQSNFIQHLKIFLKFIPS